MEIMYGQYNFSLARFKQPCISRFALRMSMSIPFDKFASVKMNGFYQNHFDTCCEMMIYSCSSMGNIYFRQAPETVH